jgi:hypothetical protein
MNASVVKTAMSDQALQHVQTAEHIKKYVENAAPLVGAVVCGFGGGFAGAPAGIHGAVGGAAGGAAAGYHGLAGIAPAIGKQVGQMTEFHLGVKEQTCKKCLDKFKSTQQPGDKYHRLCVRCRKSVEKSEELVPMTPPPRQSGNLARSPDLRSPATPEKAGAPSFFGLISGFFEKAADTFEQVDAPQCAYRFRLEFGCKVLYFSLSQQRWIPAKVVGFSVSRGTYDLDVREACPLSSISPDPTASEFEAWPAGTAVCYHSSSAGGWVDATVTSFNFAGKRDSSRTCGTYNLNIRNCAEFDRIRPRMA